VSNSPDIGQYYLQNTDINSNKEELNEIVKDNRKKGLVSAVFGSG